MAEKRTKTNIPGQSKPVDAVEVGVRESTERWSEVHLDDGSHIRLKSVVIGAVRLEGAYDADGNPVYSLKINQLMVVASAPDHLRKGGRLSEEKEVH